MYFDQIINGSWENPDTKAPVGIQINQVQIGDVLSRVQDIPELLEWSKKSVILVCDETTYEVMGRYLADLAQYGVIKLPNHVSPTLELIEALRQQIKNARHVLAVGSGTINDICKYATALNGQSYAVCATAPSMNGYASMNASVVRGGFRTSVPAHLPVGIFMDVETMSRAPRRLIQSGVGDLLCRSTAQADWLLSHLLLGTPYAEAPFAMLKAEESCLYRDAGKLFEQDEASMKMLLRLLVLSGIGMTLCRGSYPASQGEHMIAHTMEMMYGDRFPESYHGEQIGVTTLTMARLQAYKIKAGQDIVFSEFCTPEALRRFYGDRLIKDSLPVYEKKITTAHKIQEKWKRLWPDILSVIVPVMVDLRVLEQVLESIQAKRSCRDLGWGEKEYQQAVMFSRYSRDRYTFLDV